ncbi:mechanosensitive ion channel domain-containing protein [Kangiella sediminilitoris]|uniref:MscS Mechanosensitive ion channel n=1 Tax=Kangiella sediminilitoris TaxID=1144748 RepID=A0A1B3BAY8_9GAMM|nr:mechanosensitive ion channel domain-containing protein [Kangiella sediminilitoris]AOE49958.1 MscS Mechanosensitive ion channel [Kangiella sediminilitoris]
MKNSTLTQLLLLFCLTFTLGLNPAHSASSNDPLNLLKEEKESDGPEVPNIKDMSSRWWNQYAEIEEAASFEKHFTKFIDKLDQEVQAVEVTRKGEFLERIAIIRNLAQEYKKLHYKAKEYFDVPEAAISQENYNVDEFLEINQLRRQVAFLREQTLEEIKRVNQSIQQTTNTIDVLKVSYLNSEEGSNEQLAIVLNWVNSQLSKAIENQLLSNLEARENSLRTELDSLLNTLDQAKGRINFEPFAEKKRQQLENQKSDLEEQLKQLNLKLSRDISETSIGFTSYEILKLDLSLTLLAYREVLLKLQRAKQQDKLAEIESLESRAMADIDEVRTVIEESLDVVQLAEKEISKAEALARDTLLSSDINLQQQGAETNRDLQKLSEERRKKAQQLLKSMSDVRANISDNQLLLSILRDVEDIQQSGLNKTWDSIKEVTLDIWDATVALVNRPLFSINERPITLLPLIQLCFIILIGFLVSKLVSFLVHRFEKKHKVKNNSSLYLLHRLIHYLIIFIAAVAGFSALGLNLSNLTLIAGALSVGIGFGLQNLVSNFVSGLTIMFEKTLKVGDYIELEDGTTGQVKEIKTRSTRINTNDNIDVIIPNSYMVTNIVTNWTLKESTRRVRIPFGVAYGTDKEIVRKAAIEAANNVQYTLKNIPGKEPDVWLTDFGDNSVNFLMLVWVAHYGVRRPTRIQSIYMWELDTALKKYGIEIPFPQRDVHLNIVKDEDKHTLPLQSVTGESLPLDDDEKTKGSESKK